MFKTFESTCVITPPVFLPVYLCGYHWSHDHYLIILLKKLAVFILLTESTPNFYLLKLALKGAPGTERPLACARALRFTSACTVHPSSSSHQGAMKS